MSQLAATDKLRAVYDDLIARRRIVRTQADYAKEHKFVDAEKIARRELVKMSQASIEIQRELRRIGTRPGGASNPGDPTPERRIKANGYLSSTIAGKGEVSAARRYRLRSVMEFHGDKLLGEHRMAFAAFVGDADLHQRIRVADLNSRGGGSGAGIGGLGNVPDHIRDRHNRHIWVAQRLTRLEREVCDILVTHCITKRDGTAFTAEEYGALIFPMLGDKSFHRGAAVGALRHLCDHLVELYKSPLCPRVRSAREVLAIGSGEPR